MKIKITSCTNNESWYKDFIGKEFEVIREDEDIDGNEIYIVDEGKILSSFVRKENAEIIK